MPIWIFSPVENFGSYPLECENTTSNRFLPLCESLQSWLEWIEIFFSIWPQIPEVNFFKGWNLGLFHKNQFELELVSKELNHLAGILHVYAGGLNFMK